MATKKTYHKGWILRRLDTMKGVWLTTPEIRDTLGIEERTLRRWIADPATEQCGVVERDHDGVKWSREKLRPWLIAVLKLKKNDQDLTYREIAPNPPEIISDPVAQARAELGLPDGFIVARRKK